MEHFAAGINYRVHCNILKHSVVMGQHYCVKGELGWVRFSWYATLPPDPGPGSKSEKCILAAFDTINGQRKRHGRADDILESMNRFVHIVFEGVCR